MLSLRFGARAEGLPAGPDHHCRNCGAPAPEIFCPRCGQETRDRVPTLREFVRESTGRYIAWDGRLWRTLAALLFRPGFLTREYLAGRRRRYVRPGRLFLVASLLLFAVLRLVTANVPEQVHVLRGGAVSGGAIPTEESDDFQAAFDGLQNLPAVGKRIEHFRHLTEAQRVEQVMTGAFRYGPYALLVLLPVFAALLGVLYLGSARRCPGRPRRYGEHLVFAAYNHAFAALAIAGMVVVPWTAVRWAIGAWLAVYLVASLRRVYGGRCSGLVARTLVLVFIYPVVFAWVVVGLVVSAVLVP